MERYKSMVTKTGRKRYLRSIDGRSFRFVKLTEVPAEEMKRMQQENAEAEKVVEQMAEEIKHEKVCLFCGGFGRYNRMVNLKTIYLCEEHYYSENTGKVAQKMREAVK